MQTISIVGGGIGGLTAAIALNRKGFRCNVYERSAAFSEVGAAISVWPNALRVFRQLGFLDQVLETCGEVKQAFIKTRDGKVLAHTRPAYDLPAVCMHRADLLQVLLGQLPAQNLHAGYELADFDSESETSIRLKFTNGLERVSNLLIGADGIHSKVRRRIIGDGAPLFRGYNIWRGIAQLELTQGYASETWGRGNRVGIVPIREGVFGWWATANEPPGAVDEPEGTVPKLNRIFGDWHWPIPQLFNHSGRIIKNSLIDRIPVKGWHMDNAVLVGDAAHPTTPNLGQGACMAIEGAFLLAACLSKYGISARALSSYEANHFGRTQDVTQTSLRLGQVGQWQNPVATRLRDLAVSLQPQQASLRMMDKYFRYDVTQTPV
jgi:2-polyprenyl-6-methoxyphenol hydroxylase-like FAD-dependent oxidoreductase